MTPKAGAVGQAGALAADPVAVAQALFPGAEVGTRHRRGRSRPGQHEMYVVPGLRRPRILVPVGVPGAAVMLGRHNSSVRARLARAAVRSAVRTNLAALVPLDRLLVTPAQSDVLAHLGQALGTPVTAGVLLGPPRANGKPVLQLFDSAGRTVAFVKVAHSRVTRALVEHEASSLRRLHAAGLRTIELPEVLHHGGWAGLDLLALSPLTSSQQRHRRPSMPWSAMGELARCLGTRRTAVRATGLLTAIAPQVAPQVADAGGLALPTVEVARLNALLARAAQRHDDTEVELGCWHGDWAPWNMGIVDGRLQVWDWERFAQDVPVGFDPLHYSVQQLRAADRPAAAAAGELATQSAELVAALGVPATQGPLVAALYLAEVARRYLVDTRHGGNPRLLPRLRWTLEVLDHLMGTPTTATRPDASCSS